MTSDPEPCDLVVLQQSDGTVCNGDAAQKAYRLFRENPKHPSLQFKKVHEREPVYSVRVTIAYRAVGLLDNDTITWFWIGSHADYDRLLKSL